MSDYPGRFIRATAPTVTSNSASGVWTVEEALQYKQAGTWPTPVYADPNFKQTVLLLHGDGTNGAQNNTFLDSSTNNFTITRNGNTTQGTFSPFSVGAGEFSNYFDGTGDYLTAPDNAAWDFGTGDFTIETWIYPTTSGTVRVIGSAFSNSGNDGWSFELTSGNTLTFYAEGAYKVTSTGTVTANAWNHVAVSRSGTSLRLFINGVLDGSATDSTNISGSTATITISATPSGTALFTGYQSNFRVVTGTAVYTSAFTPSTTPLTAITNTSLLTCQSNRFVDNSTNAFAITRNGDVRVTPFSPFAPSAAYSASTNGGSGYFDGSGDYLTAADNADFEIGNGDFTAEAWVYLTVSPSDFIDVFGKWVNATAASQSWVLYIESNRQVGFYIRDASDNVFNVQTTLAISVNEWNHIACTRSGTSFTFYINGVSRQTGTSSITARDAASVLAVGGGSTGTNLVTGYLSDVRLVKGSVVTPPSGGPTSPLTAVSGTEFLLNFTNAGIFDNTGKNNLETVGNAQIDTGTKKYGTGSMEFDGTGDVLVIPSNENFNFGTGNFTVEFWVYIDSLAAVRTLFRIDGSTIFIIYASTDGRIGVQGGASSYIETAASTITTSTWYHIAVTKTSTNTHTIYLNGVSQATPSTAGTMPSSYPAGVVSVGAQSSGSGSLDGFIDDLRITKGVARYTANFTPPTAAFLDQ